MKWFDLTNVQIRGCSTSQEIVMKVLVNVPAISVSWLVLFEMLFVFFLLMCLVLYILCSVYLSFMLHVCKY